MGNYIRSKEDEKDVTYPLLLAVISGGRRGSAGGGACIDDGRGMVAVLPPEPRGDVEAEWAEPMDPLLSRLDLCELEGECDGDERRGPLAAVDPTSAPEWCPESRFSVLCLNLHE